MDFILDQNGLPVAIRPEPVVPEEHYFQGDYPIGAPVNLRPNVITENTRVAPHNPNSAANLDRLRKEIVQQVWGENIVVTENNFDQKQRAVYLNFPDEPRTVDVYIELSDPDNPTVIEVWASFGSRNGRLRKKLDQGSHTLGGNTIIIDIISQEAPVRDSVITVTVMAKPGTTGWSWTEDV